MSITGYANRFGPFRLAGIIAEQAFNVAGFLLNSGKPLDDDLRRIAADVAAIRKLLTSAAPVASFPARPEDAAETPPAGHGTRRGQPNVQDIPDEYWDAAWPLTRARAEQIGKILRGVE